MIFVMILICILRRMKEMFVICLSNITKDEALQESIRLRRLASDLRVDEKEKEMYVYHKEHLTIYKDFMLHVDFDSFMMEDG